MQQNNTVNDHSRESERFKKLAGNMRRMSKADKEAAYQGINMFLMGFQSGYDLRTHEAEAAEQGRTK